LGSPSAVSALNPESPRTSSHIDVECASCSSLGISPDEIDGGHTPALSRPHELVDRLEAYAAEQGLLGGH
jgi:hypothetical protein